MSKRHRIADRINDEFTKEPESREIDSLCSCLKDLGFDVEVDGDSILGYLDVPESELGSVQIAYDEDTGWIKLKDEEIFGITGDDDLKEVAQEIMPILIQEGFVYE
jgi:hypothetical protein